MYTVIALHGFEQRAVSISCDYPCDSFCVPSRLPGSSSVCKWGQNSCFYGDFTLTSPHQAAPLQAIMLAGGGRGDGGKKGASPRRSLGSHSQCITWVAFMVVSEDWRMEIRAISFLWGQFQGVLGFSSFTPSCTLCISQKHSREKVLIAWSYLESQWSRVIQHSTSTLV